MPMQKAHLIVTLAALAAGAILCAPTQAGMAPRSTVADASVARTGHPKAVSQRHGGKLTSLKVARYRDLANLRKPPAKRKGGNACGGPLPEYACAVVSWHGADGATRVGTDFNRLGATGAYVPALVLGNTAALKSLASPQRDATEVAPPDRFSGLALADANTPRLLPPRDTGYKFSYDLPVGKNESVKLQAEIRKDLYSVPVSGDPALRAAWSVRF